MGRKAAQPIKLLIVTAATVFMLSGCGETTVQESFDSNEYGKVQIEKSVPVPREQLSIVAKIKDREPEELPQEEIGQFDSAEGYSLLKLKGQRVTVCYPKLMSVNIKDNFNVIFDEGTGTTYYLHRFFSENYSDAANLSQYASDAYKRLPFKCNGKIYYPTVFSNTVMQESLGKQGQQVLTEPLKLVVCEEDDIKTISVTAAASYTVLEDGTAFMAAGMSAEKDEAEILAETRKIAESIYPYIPSAAETATVFTQRVTVGDGIKCYIPSDWSSVPDSNPQVFRPDDNSLYAGCELIVYRDAELNYCTEAANLGNGFSAKYLKYRLNSKMQYDKEQAVIDYGELLNDNEDIKLYFTEEKDTIYPMRPKDLLYLPPEGNELYSYRISFDDANTNPCVLCINFDKVSDRQVYDLIIKIAKTIQFVGGEE